jgi:hypothetical protein
MQRQQSLLPLQLRRQTGLPLAEEEAEEEEVAGEEGHWQGAQRRAQQ